MAVNINAKDVILSNEKNKEDINKYIESIRFLLLLLKKINDIDSLSNN